MPRAGKTVEVPRSEARLSLGKAEQFLEEARSAQSGSRYDAAMLNAIHAAVSAADAVTVSLGGRRSTDPDHQRTADLVEELAARSEAIGGKVRQLRSLLSRKHAVEYQSRRATAGEAKDAVERADRFVAWAREVVARARL
jgi:HEPN domain-containing protein